MIRLHVRNVCEQNALVVLLKNAIHIKMSLVHVVSFPIENMTIAAINTIWLHPILEAKWCNNNNWKVRSFQRYTIPIDACFFLWENVPFRLNNRNFSDHRLLLHTSNENDIETLERLQFKQYPLMGYYTTDWPSWVASTTVSDVVGPTLIFFVILKTFKLPTYMIE